MTRFPKIAFAAAAAVAALAFAPRIASAATVGTTFTVTAAVTKACTVSAQNISFAAGYDPNAASAATATGTVSLTCTKGVNYSVALASAGGWKLSDTVTPANKLNYQILQGATTTVWDATNLVSASAPTKATIPLVATASIAAGQDVPAGTYTDTVTVTVNY
jgi:spore coat protein U-like protein